MMTFFSSALTRFRKNNDGAMRAATSAPSRLRSLRPSGGRTILSGVLLGGIFLGGAALSGLAFAGLALTAAPHSPAQAAPGDLNKAVSALRNITTMKANFTQTDRQGQTVRGEMTLKQPGKIRFQYEAGVPLLVVSDGRSLTLVDYEVNQVQRWPIRNSPLGALLNPKSDMARFGKVISTGHSDVVSVEVRDPNRPEFGLITLIFRRKASAPGGLQLTNWVALDSQNNRTTVRLNNHRYGMAVNDRQFTYRDPRRKGRR